MVTARGASPPGPARAVPGWRAGSCSRCSPRPRSRSPTAPSSDAGDLHHGLRAGAVRARDGRPRARHRGRRRRSRPRSPIASGYWNDYAGSTDHVLRMAIVVAGSILATLAARALERSAEQRARMAVLAAVGHLSGARELTDAIEGLADGARAGRRRPLLGRRPGARRRAAAPVRAPDRRRRLRRTCTTPGSPITTGGRSIPLKDFGVLGLSSSAARYDEDDLDVPRAARRPRRARAGQRPTRHRPALHPRRALTACSPASPRR